MENTHILKTDQKTILLVDDDNSVLKIVTKILRDGDYSVITAASGKEALQKARNFSGEIHLLLSDFEMPNMNGVDLATAITFERPEIKVLLMSGFVGGTLILNEGWHFLPKPFVPSQLRALISGLVSPTKKLDLLMGKPSKRGVG